MSFVAYESDSDTELYRLRVTGSNVMMGYWHDVYKLKLPDKNSPYNSYLFEDWVEPLTDKHFKVHGRIDSILKIMGNKVSITAVESTIRNHPGVNEVYVFSFTNSRGIVRLAAAVCLGDPATQKTSIFAHCRKSLTAESVPTHIEFFTEFSRFTIWENQ